MRFKMRLMSIVFLFLGISMGAQNPPVGTLRGVVWGPMGGVAAESQVRIEQWCFDQGKPHVTTDVVVYTDSQGAFSAKLAPGVYDVFVTRLDSEPFAKKVKIVAGRETKLEPHLRGSSLTEFVE